MSRTICIWLLVNSPIGLTLAESWKQLTKYFCAAEASRLVHLVREKTENIINVSYLWHLDIYTGKSCLRRWVQYLLTALWLYVRNFGLSRLAHSDRSDSVTELNRVKLVAMNRTSESKTCQFLNVSLVGLIISSVAARVRAKTQHISRAVCSVITVIDRTLH